jgi:nitroimidazol reductase NimA-like FMN-containing flavoprotein (pyridoxamine 5'-phosphate oxidase superfamily)
MSLPAIDLTAQSYHMRRKEREITDKTEMVDLVSRQPHVTLAMCKNGIPYLVTVNHAYDNTSDRLYFHCAKAGKKADYIASNPRIFGQVLEDRGYVKGECDYDYRTVHFEGIVSLVDSSEERKRALDLLLRKFEPGVEPGDARKRFIKDESFGRVSIYRIDISGMSGKMRTP